MTSTTSGPAGPAEQQLARLRRELGRLDTIFLLMSAMVVVDTVGAIAIGGAQAFTWLVVLFVAFFVPSALASAELGAAMPDEGGAYVWVRAAFGRFAGSLASVLYWAGTPLWLGGSVTVVALAAWSRFVGELSTAGQYAFGIAFVAAATLAAVVPLRYGKWVPTSGAIGQIALLGFFTVTAVLYGIAHGFHRVAAAQLAPTPGGFVAVVPVLLYSFVGIELPSAAGGEMIDPRRDVPAAIGRAGLAQLVMYALPIVAILMVLPAEQTTSLHGLIDALHRVLTVYGGSVASDGTPQLSALGVVLGWVCAVVFVWVLMASGSSWIMGAGRAQAAACLDGAGPAALGRISARTGVPVVMALVSGGVSIVTVVVSLAVTGGDAQKYFSAALTTAIALIVLAYLFVFPAFVALRLRRPGMARPFRVPGGRCVAWVVSLTATAWSAVAAVCLVWPGVGLRHPDDALPDGFAGARMQFELLVLAPIVGVLALGCLFYSMGRRARR